MIEKVIKGAYDLWEKHIMPAARSMSEREHSLVFSAFSSGWQAGQIKAKAKIDKLEIENCLYSADAQRCWSLLPAELKANAAHYELPEALHEFIEQHRNDTPAAGWIAPHQLAELKKGYPQVISMLNSNQKTVALFLHPADSKWLPIATAPKDDTLVDIWSSDYAYQDCSSGNRRTNMRRVETEDGTVYYTPQDTRLLSVRYPTHWITIPTPPFSE